MIDNYIDNLVTERNRAWHEQKTVLDRAIADKRSLSGEEAAVVARTDETIDGLDKEIKSWEQRRQREHEHAVAREAWAPVVRPEVQERRDAAELASFVSFLRGEAGNVDNGRAWEFPADEFARVVNERHAIRMGVTGSEFRALSVGVAATAGTVVPSSTFVNRLYDYMEVYNGMLRAPVTVITTAGGEQMDFPKVVTGGTATVTSELAAIGSADPTFGRMQLNAYKYGQLVRLSRELLEDTGVDIEGFLARDFGRALGRVTNVQYTVGTGSSAPQGVMTAVGTATTGATGGTGVPSFDNLIDVLYSVNSDYRSNGAVWMMRDSTAGYIRKLKDTDGQYLWQPSTQVGQPDRLLGFPVIENPAVAATGTGVLSIAFGDFSSFYVRMVGGVRVEQSTERYFDTDEVAWKAVMRTDSDLIDLTGSIKAFRGGTA
jgi:HK97 family phage major capsid protein